jgi:hypothetical protein
MTDHQHPPLQEESAMDYAEHESTYSGFVTLVKWTTLGLAALMVILYFLVQP